MGHRVKCKYCGKAHQKPVTFRILRREFELNKWHYVGMGVFLLVAGVVFMGREFTIGVCFARVLDEVGAVLFEHGARGIEGE